MWYEISNPKLLTGVAFSVWVLGALVLGIGDVGLIAAASDWSSPWIAVGRAGNVMLVGAFPAVVLSAYVRATSLNRVTLGSAVVTWAGAFLAHFQVLNMGWWTSGSTQGTASGLLVVVILHVIAVVQFVQSPQ